jgi:hypothetical protein
MPFEMLKQLLEQLGVAKDSGVCFESVYFLVSKIRQRILFP